MSEVQGCLSVIRGGIEEKDMIKIVKRIALVLLVVAIAGIYSYGVWDTTVYDANSDSNSYTNTGTLQEGSKVEQTFYCSDNGLQSLSVRVSNLGLEVDGTYEWSLTESESQKVIAQGEYDTADIDNGSASVLEFERQEESKDKEYVFTFSEKELKSEAGMTLMTTDIGQDDRAELYVNGERSDQTMVLTQHVKFFNLETFIVFLGLVLYLVAFMGFLIKIFR